MKRKLFFGLTLSALLLSACNNPTPSSSSSTCSHTTGLSSSTTSLTSESSSSESSSGPKKASELPESEYKLFPSLYMDKVASLSSYKAITDGSSVASILFIQITQPINVTTIKGKEYNYLHNDSKSDKAQTDHEAFFKGETAVYKDNHKSPEDYTKTTLPQYKETFGVYPFDRCIEGYVINEETVKEVTRVEGDSITYKLTLDPKKSTVNVIKQMKVFGDLDDLPSFANVYLNVTVLDDFTPVSIYLDAWYSSKKVISVDCHQTYTVTFSEIGQDVTIPNVDKVENLFK